MSDFIEQFTKDKGVRDLIKRKTLKSTNLSASSGGLRGWGWQTDKNGLCNINNSRDFRSTISRNRDIRRFVEKSVAHELRLFGVQSWMVNIGKLSVKESI